MGGLQLRCKTTKLALKLTMPPIPRVDLSVHIKKVSFSIFEYVSSCYLMWLNLAIWTLVDMAKGCSKKVIVYIFMVTLP